VTRTVQETSVDVLREIGNLLLNKVLNQY
jgi:hypothetical protein